MTNLKPRHAMDTILVTGGAGFIGSNFDGFVKKSNFCVALHPSSPTSP